MTPAEIRSRSSARLQREWETDERWAGIERGYGADEVIRLRGSVEVAHSLARRGAEKLWRLLQTESHVPALGAITGNQAVQMVRAGLKAIYLSGWQVAGDGNLAESPYPDQGLYPVNSVPSVVRRINNALRRADQIQWAEGNGGVDGLVPIVADAEAGFGGPLKCLRTDEEHDRDGLEPVIARMLAYAPYADVLWFETSTPDLDEALEFAAAIHAQYPGKLLAYNCSPSFNWKRALGDEEIASFQRKLADAGYRFQFVTLAGFHAIASSMFALAEGYAREGMTA